MTLVLERPQRDTADAAKRPGRPQRLTAARAAMVSALAQRFRARLPRLSGARASDEAARELSRYLFELEGGDTPKDVLAALADTLNAQLADMTPPPAAERSRGSFAARIKAERAAGAGRGLSR